MKSNLVVMAAVAVLAAAGGYFAAQHLQPASDPDKPATQYSGNAEAMKPEDLLGQPRPDFSHSDSSGRTVSARDFDGRPLLLNFWATWCTPCVEEMPMLSKLQDDWSDSGLNVVGIALDDAERAAAFAAEMNLSYPVLLGATDVVVTGRRYGNRSGMLPFSVLVDSQGIIRWSYMGALKRTQLEQALADIE